MKVKIINGPPCSGKSTYCEKMMKEKDIVYDYDQLSKALRYDKKHRLERDLTHDYVIDFRLSILKRLKVDEKVDTVYFISSQKPSNNLLEFLQGVDYEVIKMDVTKEECLERLEKDDTRTEKKKWKEKIEQWFEENGGEKLDKNIPKEKLEQRQFRQMKPLEIRQREESSESDFLVEGYAMKYEPYWLYEDRNGPVFEEFKRDAFKDSDMSDVIMLYDHQGKVLARTSNNTLKVTLDDTGMYMEADLSKSRAAKEMYEEIQAGLVTRMSWSFLAGGYHFDKESRTIVHDSIAKVYDVSAVGIPANNDTSINARKFVNGVIDEFETERFQEQQRRKKLQIKIKLEMERKQ